MRPISFLLSLLLAVAFSWSLIACDRCNSIAQTKPSANARQLQRGEGIRSLPGKNQRWALVIGIDDYSESQITKLSGAANDARTLASALTRYAGFPEDQVILLASDQPSQFQPHRSTILRYLSNLRGTVPKDGLLLVSFAGHGIERGGRAFLLPSDALGVDDMRLLEDTAISVDRIRESIRATGVGQVILILDACRSDPAPGRTAGDNLMTADFRKSFNFDVRNQDIRAFATLYATDVGERAYEYDVKKQGYFTWALVDALGGAAANENGEITLANLLKYIQETVPKLVHRDLGSDKQQRPFAIIEGYQAESLVIAAADVSMNVRLLPTVDQLIALNIKAIGGKPAVESLRSIVATGFYETTAGNTTWKGDLEEFIKLPDKSLSITSGDLSIMEGFDGVLGWTSDSNGPQTMSALHLGLVKRNLAMSFLTDIKTFNQLYPRTLLKGIQKIGDQEAYVVEAKPDDARAETLYFDKKTGLLVRWDFMDDSDVSQPGVLHPSQLYLENYTEIAGVMVPLTQRHVISGYSLAMRLGSVKFNIPIDDDKFSIPSPLVPLSIKPQLSFNGQEDYEANGKNWTRFKLSVTNRAVYPNEMFALAPNLPPCGLNINSSRTWVDVYSGDEKRLYGFCAFSSSDQLSSLWFVLPRGQTPPSDVFIVLTDRQSNARYKSTSLAIPLSGMSDSSVSTSPTVKAKPNASGMRATVKAFTIELQSCKMLGSDVTCELTVTNSTGGDKEFALCQADSRVSRRGKDTTTATDNIGNQYEPSESVIGSNSARKGYLLKSVLPPQVPVRMALTFGKVGPAGSTFSLLRIAIYEEGNGHPELIAYADFRNVGFEK